MSVRQASELDKDGILDFCKNTFSWGDYIAQIWDYWISEGGLLVTHENGMPVAMCHVFSDDENCNLWIEGIRVSSDHRRKKHATNLIRRCEKIAAEKKYRTMQMLVETRNSNSVRLSEKLRYANKETWDFYLLDGKTQEKRRDGASSLLTPQREEFLLNSEFHFVDSWRWFPLTRDSVCRLSRKNQIVFSEDDGGDNNAINGVAVFARSRHFKDTVIVTVLMGDDKGIQSILSEISSMSKQQGFRRIQVLTKMKALPKQAALEKKLSFYLFEKLA